MRHVATVTTNDHHDVSFVLDALDTRLAVHSPVFDTWGDVVDSKLVWANQAWRAAPTRAASRDAVLSHLAMAWRQGKSSGVVRGEDDPAGSWVTWSRANDHLVEAGAASGTDAWGGWIDGDGRAPVLVARRAVSLERTRMARGLHDLAIQRLYASRLKLSALDGNIADELRHDVDCVAESIDAVITDLREQILQTVDSAGPGLRSRVEECLAAIVPSHGCDVDVDVDDELRVSGHIWSHARPMLIEAVSNAVRHGGASMIWVSVGRQGRHIVFTVADNGSGIGVPSHSGHFTPGNGIRNMDNRAHTLGGTCRVSPRDAGGTLVEWSVPIDGGPR